MSRHAREEDVPSGSEPGHGDSLPLQVTNGANPLRGEQLEAAHMKPGQEHDRIAGVHSDDERGARGHAQVDLPVRDGLVPRRPAAGLDVLNVAEPLAPQESSATC